VQMRTNFGDLTERPRRTAGRVLVVNSVVDFLSPERCVVHPAPLPGPGGRAGARRGSSQLYLYTSESVAHPVLVQVAAPRPLAAPCAPRAPVPALLLLLLLLLCCAVLCCAVLCCAVLWRGGKRCAGCAQDPREPGNIVAPFTEVATRLRPHPRVATLDRARSLCAAHVWRVRRRRTRRGTLSSWRLMRTRAACALGCSAESSQKPARARREGRTLNVRNTEVE